LSRRSSRPGAPDEAARAKREAEATCDPKEKQRLEKTAEDDKAKAINFENDVA
jgi:hypothetical protein